MVQRWISIPELDGMNRDQASVEDNGSFAHDGRGLSGG